MAYDPNNETEEAASLLALARQTHEAHVAAAKAKAQSIISGAELEASTILSQAREEFSWLEGKIAQHKEFERRYRTAISTYLQELLDEIGQDDEFTGAPAPVAAAPEPVVEVESAFEVEAEIETIDPEPVAAEEAPEPVYEGPVYEEHVPEPEVAPEPAYEAPAEPEYQEPIEEPSYEAPEPAPEEPVFEEAPEEPVYEGPVYQDQNDREADEFTYAPAPVADADEVEDVPTFAEGEAPVPSFSEQPVEHEEEDLPVVTEALDSYGSAAEEIAALDSELQDHHPEDREEIENFDALLAGEPKPATSAITTVHDDDDESSEDEDKGVRSFFGFKKH